MGALGDGDEPGGRQDLHRPDERPRTTAEGVQRGGPGAPRRVHDRRYGVDHGREGGVDARLGAPGEHGRGRRRAEQRRPGQTVAFRSAGDALDGDEHPGDRRRGLDDVEVDGLRGDEAGEPERRAAERGAQRPEAAEAEEGVEPDRGGTEGGDLGGDPGDERREDREEKDVGEGGTGVRRGEERRPCPGVGVVHGKVAVADDLTGEHPQRVVLDDGITGEQRVAERWRGPRRRQGGSRRGYASRSSRPG